MKNESYELNPLLSRFCYRLIESTPCISLVFPNIESLWSMTNADRL